MELKKREEIIKSLECCSTTNCTDCPYTKNGKVDIFDITCSINMAKDALALIKELTQEIKDLEEDYDCVYEQAEADIRGNIADGGTSCHWCMDGHRRDVVRKMQERLKSGWCADSERCCEFIDQVANELLEENK